MLEELPGIGCVLDSGSLSLRAALGDAPLQTWFAVAGSRLGLLLLSDHDGVSRADLLLGSGVFDPRALVEVVGRDLPRVLRPDPELPPASVEEVSVRLESLLGPGPE